ncbi:U-box domain-containing protein 9-like isoform X1 [Prosopis cineraria]|uniref:U-box domain-containing protein 9-like isoform X1 n=2 Tax=Prosopis cineraria TaxID=364024 RepID=UPI00240EB1A4|nr:U-box domain-containing protein 9-like isoform X1 [Prosopis cineraria]XP_054792952.1 U-box domain-containing protein 9-like isoform X1 [Prosopis cineraria]
MAKIGVSDYDSTLFPHAKALDLKQKLRGLVNIILDAEDFPLARLDEAITTLSALKDLKCKSTGSFPQKFDDLSIPPEFRCPISQELMSDPVILATGQTYDRPFIQRWLNEGHRTCPQTQQVLSHSILTPNHLVRDMISHWCEENGVELPKLVQDIDEVITGADRSHLNSLLKKLSMSISDQKAAAKELRLLTKRMPSFRILFNESSDVILQLLSPLSPGTSYIPPDLHEDLITTVLNLSIHDDNKKMFAESPMVIPLLIESLKFGTIQTRSNAAAAIFTLSALDSNKSIIGNSGAIKHLIELLEEGHPLALKDAASAIFSLCLVHENKGRTVREGAVPVILNKIVNRVLVDELLAILALLSSHPKAVEEMSDLGVVPLLLSIIRESTSESCKENCVAILYTICLTDRTKWKEIREEEKAKGTLSELAQCGTSRAKRKANGILQRLNRSPTLTHTA